MATPVLVLVVAFYAAVATAYLEAGRRREAPPDWARWAGPLSVAAHLAGLVALGQETGRSPFASGAQSLSFVAFALAGLYLLLELTSRVSAYGGGFYVTAALLTALSVPGLLHGEGGSPPPARDALRTVHVGLSLLSAAAVFAGGLLALGYLRAYRRVKRRTLGDDEGPSLSGFERLERHAATLSVALLLPSLLLGVRTVAAQDGAVTGVGAWALVGLTGGLLGLLAGAGWIWWRRPLKGRLAAGLQVGATLLLVVAVLFAHPLALKGGS